MLLDNFLLKTYWCTAMAALRDNQGVDETDCSGIQDAMLTVRVYETVPPDDVSSGLACIIDGSVANCNIAQNLDSSMYEFTTYVGDSLHFFNTISISGCNPLRTYYGSVRYEYIRDEDGSMTKLIRVSGASVAFSIFASILLAYLMFKSRSYSYK